MGNNRQLQFPFWRDTILNSYSQIFFSENKLFAILLLCVTLFDIKLGILGLVAAILINIFAKVIIFMPFKKVYMVLMLFC